MKIRRSHRLVGVILGVLLLMGLAPAASAKIEIYRIVYDPPGKDTGTNWHLNR
jgi:hypothetical protein